MGGIFQDTQPRWGHWEQKLSCWACVLAEVDGNGSLSIQTIVFYFFSCGMISATFSKAALQLPFPSSSWFQSILQFSVWGGIVSTLFFSNLIIVSPTHFPKKTSYDWKASYSFKSHVDEKYSVCLNHDSHFIDGETWSAGMWKDLPPAAITAWSCVLCVEQSWGNGESNSI